MQLAHLANPTIIGLRNPPRQAQNLSGAPNWLRYTMSVFLSDVSVTNRAHVGNVGAHIWVCVGSRLGALVVNYRITYKIVFDTIRSVSITI